MTQHAIVRLLRPCSGVPTHAAATDLRLGHFPAAPGGHGRLLLALRQPAPWLSSAAGNIHGKRGADERHETMAGDDLLAEVAAAAGAARPAGGRDGASSDNVPRQ